MRQLTIPLFILFSLYLISSSKVFDFEKDIGGIPNDSSLKTAWKNGGLLNTSFAALKPGDTFIFPNKTFHLMGGIFVKDIRSIVFKFEGTLIFNDDIKVWPADAKGQVYDCFHFENITNVTFTSSGKGLIDGSGEKWWGIPGIGYLTHEENRPKLFNIGNSKQLLVEHIIFKNSPYWTFWAHEIDGLEVRYSEITAKRTNQDQHDIIDMSAFNTDGFDVTGKNVWIHDSTVWNQDDCFCVKDGSENMLFERINASGVGLTIGSISGSTVRNITFRDVFMHNTYKGIYMKFRAGDKPGLIQDILYENVYMENPKQWPIWIGPAQQADSGNLCAAHPCSLCWPSTPLAKCNMPAAGKYKNIVLRNITISNPKRIGVIMANETNVMENVVFDGVRYINLDKKAETQYYKCDNVKNGVAKGNTWPVPPCFKDQTIFNDELIESEERRVKFLSQ